jgi:hypothetical protein
LSDLLAINTRLLNAAADGQNELTLKALWEVEASVLCMTGCPTNASLLAVADVCLKLAKQDAGDEIPACIDVVLESVRAATSSAVPARGNATKARASCVLLEQLTSVVGELACSASLRSHVSRSVKMCQVRIEEAVERLVRHVLSGSLWEKTRGVLARLEEEMTHMSNVENLTPADQKEWEESWKAQTNEVSSHLKAFKASFRSVAQSSQVTVTLVEAWTLSLVEVVKQIRVLIAPFFAADASAAYMSSSTAIVRAVQWMGGEFVKFVDFAVLHPDEKIADLQSALATDVDACLSALNSNNPGLVGVRGGEAGRGWMRRGEISTQGAALKMKLTKKKAAAATDAKFLAGRKKQESSQTALDTSASSLNANESLSLRRSGSGKMPTVASKLRRPPSGEWDEDG